MVKNQHNLLPVPFELAARQFDLVARRLADDLTYGSDVSRFVGSGIDYAQSRLYAPGDSLRSIDWRVTARTGRFHVKEYDAPKRLPVYIIVDTSSSMSIASMPLSKLAVAAWIGGALALVAHRRRSPVALIAGGARDHVPPPTLIRERVLRWVDALRTPPAGVEATAIAQRIEHVESLADRTSFIIVISDLHDPSALAALKRVRQRHDALAVQVVDPAEEGALRAGFLRGAEAETGRTFFAHHRTHFFSEQGVSHGPELAQAGVDHLLLRTDRPFVADLRRALSSRSGGRVAR
ncbi:MAG: DUF58 domain-containing protein [Phycisphaerales bacterium]